MGKRKSKKQFKPGTLITVQGTRCVFMSLGLKGDNTIESMNGIDIITGKPVSRCDGKARLATKREQMWYWIALRHIIEKK